MQSRPISDQQRRHIIESAHLKREKCKSFPTWAVLTSSWAHESEGFHKAWKFCRDHEQAFANLDKEFSQLWERSRQPEWELRCKLDFTKRLELALSQALGWPLELVITGSTVSGVGLAGSDIDICMRAPGIIHPLQRDVVQPGPYESADAEPRIRMLNKDEQRSRYGQLLRKCKKIIGALSDLGLTRLEFVDAQIPLLKMAGSMVDQETGNTFVIDADLSVSNSVFVSGLYNSHLIRGYTRVDPRVAPLVTLVKRWAGDAGIKDGQKRRFNSYAMTLLVIHFLQCGLPQPLLPNLQALYPHVFAMDENNHPDTVDLEAPLPEELPVLGEIAGYSVAELFYLFCAYYSSIDLRTAVIRVKCGRISRRGALDREMRKESDEDVCYPPEYAKSAEIFVEDPIDEHNPGRTVDDWELVRSCFQDTLHVFDRVDDPVNKDRFLFPDLEDLIGTDEN